MKINNIVYTILLMFAATILLVGQASANQIQVFAPLNYAGVAPSFPTPFAVFGAFASNGAAGITPATGGVTLSANPGATGNGLAQAWVDTGWLVFQGQNQAGSVHAGTWLTGAISALGAGFRVYLWVIRMPGFQIWQKMWTYAMGGNVRATVDLGIFAADLSNGGQSFQWLNGFQYDTRVLIQAFAGPNTQASCDAKFDDVLYITYLGSPEPHWIQLVSNPQIHLYPPQGPAGTKVSVNGTGFAPESTVYIYFDGTSVNKTVVSPSGSFESLFNVPSPSSKGPHVVRAIDSLENTAYDFFDVFLEAPPIVGDINNDGKVDGKDIAHMAKNYGKTDPNVDPPGTAQAKDIFVDMFAFALIAPVTIGLFRLGKRQRTKAIVK